MTYGCRQSDRPVVPEKSSNKPDKVGAERMEGRGLPKENRLQQNAFRTQRRLDVYSELELIHQKAKMDFHGNDLVSDPKEEPCALKAHAGICAGGVG